MAARFTLEIDGKAEFDREFARLDARFDDLTPIWPTVRDKFWEIEKKQFSSEGAQGRGGKWKELSPRYKLQKQKRFPGMKILQATGEMYRSLTGQTSNTIYRTSKDEIVIGTSLRYALFHHRGGSRLPKREPVSFSRENQNELMKAIQLGLVKEMRKGRFIIESRDR